MSRSRSSSVTSSRPMSMGRTRVPITSVVAVTPTYGIGNHGTVPWGYVGKTLKHDLLYFRRMTIECLNVARRNAVVMGRRTWESIPLKNRPLAHRINFIVSSSLTSEMVRRDLQHALEIRGDDSNRSNITSGRSEGKTDKIPSVSCSAIEDYVIIETANRRYYDDDNVLNSLSPFPTMRNSSHQNHSPTPISPGQEALRQCPSRLIVIVPTFSDIFSFINEQPILQEVIEKIVVIGGCRLFEESLFHPWFETLHLTQVQEEFECDTYLSNKTIDYLSKLDLDNFVVQDNIIEDGVKYR